MNGARILAGQFRLLQRLGAGSMGEVWRALDINVEREVAVKLLRPELASNAAFVDRFRTEAVVLARLNHPNIANLYTLVREGEALYMVMEFVPGTTLDHVLARRGRLGWTEVRDLALAALAGLAHAHAAGIVHRDIKPANILITPTGVLKLTDFGIARMRDRSRMTRAGNWVGTMEYASPEQVRGEAVDGRSDLYSLAIVLYELLTGELPFKADTDYSLMKAQLETPPPRAALRVPGLPAEFDEALWRAMAKQPADRFEDAAAFAQALRPLGAVAGAVTGVHLSSKSLVAASSLLSAGRLSARLASGMEVLRNWLAWRPQALSGRAASGAASPSPPWTAAWRNWIGSTSMADSQRVASSIHWMRTNPVLAAAAGVGLVALGLVVVALRPAPSPPVVIVPQPRDGVAPSASVPAETGVSIRIAPPPDLTAPIMPASGAASVPAQPRAGGGLRPPAGGPLQPTPPPADSPPAQPPNERPPGRTPDSPAQPKQPDSGWYIRR
jgi:serine/threonine-protein kinase